jgi:hypothetical protein
MTACVLPTAAAVGSDGHACSPPVLLLLLPMQMTGVLANYFMWVHRPLQSVT